MIQATNEAIPRDTTAADKARERAIDDIERWEDEGGGPPNRAGIDRRPSEVRAVREVRAVQEPRQVQPTPIATGLFCPVCGCEEGCLHRWADDGGPVPAAPGGFFLEPTHAMT